MKFLFTVSLITLLLFCSCNRIKTEGEIPLQMPVSPPKFIIQPGDSIRIVVWQKPELSTGVTVRPDGKIRLLLIGELSVEGKTLEQIQRQIGKRLTKYLQNPVVEVTLASPNFGIYMFGEIAGKGRIMVRKNITLLEALIRARGFTAYADKTRIVVIRRIPGKEIRYPFNFDLYLSFR